MFDCTINTYISNKSKISFQKIESMFLMMWLYRNVHNANGKIKRQNLKGRNKMLNVYLLEFFLGM